MPTLRHTKRAVQNLFELPYVALRLVHGTDLATRWVVRVPCSVVPVPWDQRHVCSKSIQREVRVGSVERPPALGVSRAPTCSGAGHFVQVTYPRRDPSRMARSLCSMLALKTSTSRFWRLASFSLACSQDQQDHEEIQSDDR